MIRRRRLRASENLRALVRETSVSASDLIYPVFVIEGKDIKNPIDSMPGIYQYSIDRLDEELDRIREAGVKGVLLFGIPAHKDECGTEAYNEHGIIQEAIRYIKKVFPELVVIADICLCEYTSHGHCGVIKDEAGYEMTPIMAYSAKMASGYYGPFRDAAHSAPGFGDRKTYQMDYHNPREAMRDIQDDIDEGADIIIIKPALAFLDILKTASWETDMPLCAYNVSGEYSMVKAAAANGWIDEKKIVMENMIGMKRAGAQMIITYHALDVANWLKEE